MGVALVARILLWTPNFAPDLTGIPPLVTDAAEWLARRGHEIQVVTTFPHYPQRRLDPAYSGALWRTERRHGIPIDRSWLRVRPRERLIDKALYEASFAALSLPHMLRRLPRADVLACVVPSFAASLAATALAGRGRRRRLVLWVQDLVLDAALSLADVGPRATQLLALARRLEPLPPRAADAVVVCSPGFADHLVRIGVPEERVTTILNWVDTERFVASPPPAADRLRLLYTGNVGYTQGFGTLADAARLLGDEVEVVIAGDGNAAEEVTRLAAKAPVFRFISPVSREEYPALLASAHVQLVLQRRISAGANLPSKIASYLASGRPVVASIQPETPAAELLRASGAAVLVEPEDPVALAAAVRRLAAEPELRAALGAAGRNFALRELSRERLLPRFERVLIGAAGCA
jgi:colanic acid biosynthesis glycosyl transferase WcaI